MLISIFYLINCQIPGYRIKGEEKWKNKGEFTGNETEIEVDKVGIYEVQVYHGEEAISDIKEVII